MAVITSWLGLMRHHRGLGRVRFPFERGLAWLGTVKLVMEKQKSMAWLGMAKIAIEKAPRVVLMVVNHSIFFLSFFSEAILIFSDPNVVLVTKFEKFMMEAVTGEVFCFSLQNSALALLQGWQITKHSQCMSHISRFGRI